MATYADQIRDLTFECDALRDQLHRARLDVEDLAQKRHDEETAKCELIASMRFVLAVLDQNSIKTVLANRSVAACDLGAIRAHVERAIAAAVK